jgi:purine-binding chemotaxis protein CheW
MTGTSTDTREDNNAVVQQRGAGPLNREDIVKVGDKSAKGNIASLSRERGDYESDLTTYDNDSLFLTFTLRQEVYGLRVQIIKEVMNYIEVYPTPLVPHYIHGVINLRGEVIPVIDLNYRFFDQQAQITEDSSIVVVEIEDEEDLVPVGVVIDSVDAVIPIEAEEISATPELGTKIPADFIAGIGKKKDRFIMILNEKRVLDLNELADFAV